MRVIIQDGKVLQVYRDVTLSVRCVYRGGIVDDAHASIGGGRVVLEIVERVHGKWEKEGDEGESLEYSVNTPRRKHRHPCGDRHHVFSLIPTQQWASRTRSHRECE